MELLVVVLRDKKVKTVYGVVLNPAHHQQPRTPPNFPSLSLLLLFFLFSICFTFAYLSIYLLVLLLPAQKEQNDNNTSNKHYNHYHIFLQNFYNIELIYFLQILCYSYCCYIYYNMHFNL